MAVGLWRRFNRLMIRDPDHRAAWRESVDARLGLLRLEDRRLLSATATFAAGTLQLQFQPGDDSVQVDADAADRIQIVSQNDGNVPIQGAAGPVTITAADIQQFVAIGNADGQQRLVIRAALSPARGVSLGGQLESAELLAPLSGASQGPLSVDVSTVRLAAGLQSDGQAIELTGKVVLAASTRIDTELGGDGTAGLVRLGTLTAETDSASLSIDTSAGAGFAGGNILLQGSDDSAGHFPQNLSLTAEGHAAGDMLVGGTTTVGGQLQIAHARRLRLEADVTAGKDLVVTDISDRIELAAAVELTALDGSISTSSNDNVNQIDLIGVGGSNVVTATQQVNLSRVVDTGAPDRFEINAGVGVTLTSVDIENALDVNAFDPFAPQPPTIFVVTNTNDSGPGSLRQAILDANATANGGLPDQIHFALPTSEPMTIRPSSALPEVTDPVFFDGWTQPGFSDRPLIEISGTQAGAQSHGLVITSGNSIVRGLIVNRFARRGIILSVNGNNVIVGSWVGIDALGSGAAGNGSFGLAVLGGSSDNRIGTNGDGIQDTLERNVFSGNDDGIHLDDLGTERNVIAGNFIGTDATGTVAIPNRGDGIDIEGGASNTRVGSNFDGIADAAERNVISGNGENGIELESPRSTGNIIAGNFIGTDVTGRLRLGNGADGVSVRNTPNNTIDRNLLSANGDDGVDFISSGSTGNRVIGNWIGLDVTGTATLGNRGNGVESDRGPANNVIGGVQPGQANVISGNQENGVHFDRRTNANIVIGNLIGSDPSGTMPLGNSGHGIALGRESADGETTGNRIGGTLAGEGNLIAFNASSGISVINLLSVGNQLTGNRIFGNGQLGIDLAGGIDDAFGVTANDADDADSGPNNLQNHPLINSAVAAAGVLNVAGSLQTAPGTAVQIEWFLNDQADGSGHGEGARFVGSTIATADSSGTAVFTASFSTTASAGQSVTATATNVTTGDTSEFSAALSVTVVEGSAVAGTALPRPVDSPFAGSGSNVVPAEGQMTDPPGMFQLLAGNIRAGQVSVYGLRSIDTFSFVANVEATAGSILIQQAGLVQFAADVTANQQIGISRIHGAVRLSAGHQVTSDTADVLIDDQVQQIQLDGNGDTILVMASGSIQLAPISNSGLVPTVRIVAGNNVQFHGAAMLQQLDVDAQGSVNSTASIAVEDARLLAGTGIGSSIMALPLDAAMLTAENRGTGNIDVLNERAGAVNVERLASVHGGSIQYRQTVAADVSIGDVSVLDGTAATTVRIVNLLGDVTVRGQINLVGQGLLNMVAGSHRLRFDAGSQVAAGSADIHFTSDAIELQASVGSTGTLTLEPFDPARSIALGQAPNGGYQLGVDELSLLQDGFSQIVIGRSQDGSGNVTALDAAFVDRVSVFGGSIQVGGFQALDQTVQLTARNGSIIGDSDRDLDVVAGQLQLLATAQIGTATGNEQLDIDLAQLTAASTIAGDIVLSAVGTRNLVIHSVTAVEGSLLLRSDTQPVTLVLASVQKGNIAAVVAGDDLRADHVSVSDTGSVFLRTDTQGSLHIGRVTVVQGSANLDAADRILAMTSASQVIMAPTATLRAFQGIGESAAAVRVDSPNVVALNETAGGVFLRATGNDQVAFRVGNRGPGRVQIEGADGPVLLTDIAAAGGDVQATVDGHNLTARNVVSSGTAVTLSTLNTGSLQVRRIAAQNAVVDLVSAEPLIAIDADTTTNVTARQLRLGLVNGMATGSPLTTQVERLAAQGRGPLSIRDLDDVQIGTVQNTSGIQIQSGGVTIIAGGQLDVASSIVVATNETVRLASGPSADLLLRAPLQVSDGGGASIDSGGDLVIFDSAPLADVSVSGSGTITAFASGSIVLQDTAFLQTATGRIHHVPLVEDQSLLVVPVSVGGSNVDAFGKAMIDVTLGDGVLPEQNFQITIDWGDGTLENFPFPGQMESNTAMQFDAGTHRFLHTYDGNPNKNDPSAKIPIAVTVRFDPRDGGFEPTVNPNGTNGILLFADGERSAPIQTTVARELSVPGEGVSSTIFVTRRGGIQPVGRPDAAAQLLAAPPAVPRLVRNVEELLTTDGLDESIAADVARLYFVEIDVLGRVKVDDQDRPIEFDLPLELLEGDRVFDLFKKFPNGHYRVFFQQGTKIRRLYDLHVEDNQLVNPDQPAADAPQQGPAQPAPPADNPDLGAATDRDDRGTSVDLTTADVSPPKLYAAVEGERMESWSDELEQAYRNNATLGRRRFAGKLAGIRLADFADPGRSL